ncbi:hypothetical protein T4B_4772 [Trichinella pseudospiralis]|uniref:Uncharacterized protein n=1 Tax=Trichinella pseudospiralis TaxID=6337 RepID=A0A0V1GA31_TRIPS|nr:hypothetical protein T4B_4772 [Trichinella pseudospiralis]
MQDVDHIIVIIALLTFSSSEIEFVFGKIDETENRNLNTCNTILNGIYTSKDGIEERSYS